jgi:hypothetical protein
MKDLKSTIVQLLINESIEDPSENSYELRVLRDNDFERVAEMIVSKLSTQAEENEQPEQGEEKKTAEQVLDDIIPCSYYTPIYPKHATPIHEQECQRCKIEEGVIKAMELYAQQFAASTPTPEPVRDESKGVVRATFGLTEKNISIIEKHLKRREDALYDYYIWKDISREIGWETTSAALWYFKHHLTHPSPLPQPGGLTWVKAVTMPNTPARLHWRYADNKMPINCSMSFKKDYVIISYPASTKAVKYNELEYLSETSQSSPVVGEGIVNKGLGICKEEGCKKFAIADYNGHGYYVCRRHMDSLSGYFG